MKRILCLMVLVSTSATAQVTTEDMNKSNNPLSPSIGANVQDQYSPELYDSDAHTNDLLLRGAMPIAAGHVFKLPQIFRLTMPVSTRPSADGDYTTGAGDLNIFDIFLLGKTGGGIGFGAGPLITFPTASDDVLGTGKWQGGVALLAMLPEPTGIRGALLQIQGSFAGDEEREDVASETLQPLWIRNLPKGWYLRSTGIWMWNLKSGDFFIPIGIGAGKIWKSGGTTFNLFAEPQWTVARDGAGWPRFGVFSGLNTTFER